MFKKQAIFTLILIVLFSSLVSAQWWNSSMPYKRDISFTVNDSISTDFTHRVIFEKDADMGTNCESMTLIFADTTEINSHLRLCNNTHVEIAWKEQEGLFNGAQNSNISVYYGSPINKTSDNDFVYAWNDDLDFADPTKYITFGNPGTFNGETVCYVADSRPDIKGNFEVTDDFTVEFRADYAASTIGQNRVGVMNGQPHQGNIPFVALGGNGKRVMEKHDGTPAQNETPIIGSTQTGLFEYSITVVNQQVSATQNELSLGTPFSTGLTYLTTTGVGAGWSNGDDAGTKCLDYIRVFEDKENRPTYTLGDEVLYAPLPDLAITQLEIFPSNPEVGKHVNANVTITNVGAATADSFTWTYDFEYKVENSQDGGGLDPGESINLIFQHTYTTGGDKAFYIEVDPDNSVEELDEDNNIGIIEFFVDGQPDLVPFLLNAEVVDNNTLVEFTFSIANFGNIFATDVLWDLEFGDGSGTGGFIGEDIPIGENVTFIVLNNYPTFNNYPYMFTVDPHDTIDELNESNNVLRGTVHVNSQSNNGLCRIGFCP